MLKFYYNSRSPMARRVWLGLLEKGIEFEPILMRLNGDQMQSEYLGLNPFHHVPVIVDGDFRVIESLAILDYLEAKYPIPALSPKEPQALATVKIVQMVSSNELLPKLITLLFENEDSPKYVHAKQHIDIVLKFWSEILGDNLYFGGDSISLADIIAGTDISMLKNIDIGLSNYPRVNNWLQRLMQREVWQKTELTEEELKQFKRVFMILNRRKNREK
ncbi:glutathione S-transferase family protein [Brunnivagina elsteri]|uniref:Glutathione S-transferase n=1 Tax=Brunnivagina elsteri CCALA 953 TaxID=987040 RepID=A0A2A2TD82_9CYAN|nr:glutathione S-transferase family protein [Calothrix elsteri]PAX51661.1 glutathione S-transferase [Calothrix elsteri CCALA 953]